MSRISPFVGLFFDPELVGSLDLVTTPPYDVISPDEQRRFSAASPYNMIRLELGAERPGDDEAENKYRRAASDYRDWRAAGVLAPIDGPRYYAYEMRFTYHGQPRRLRGLICAVDLEDWGGSILPHERTMKAPVEDRLRLMRAVNANLSSIQAVFPGPSEPLAALMDGAMTGPPHRSTVDEAGVEHRLWLVPGDEPVTAWLASESLMIADGHHRYTMALTYRDEMRTTHGPGPWDQVMMLIVDSAVEDPPVLPYHRMLTRTPPVTWGTRVRDLAETLAALDDGSLAYGVVSREGLGDLVHRVATLGGAEPPTVCALHERVLVGVDDALRFTHDAAAAEDAVRHGEAVAAYLLPPTTAGRIRAVIDRGERLPQKSTFFWPKPRSGMVIRPLD